MSQNIRIAMLIILHFSALLSAFGQAKNKEILTQDETQAIKIRTFSLPSTTAQLLSLGPERGMVIYNTNPSTTGTLSYPSIGVGVYVFDGIGWVISKSEKLNFSNTNTNPGLINAVLLLDEGDFMPPNAIQEAGRYYYIRNTSKINKLSILGVIDFGEDTAKNISLAPKEGTMMIYSDGKNWYRLK
jgi:hypothetical protein